MTEPDGQAPSERRGQGPKDEAAMAAEGVAEAVAHLQTAALSVVAAVRAGLDAAERLARNPGPLLDLLTDAARAGRATSDAAGGAMSPEPARKPRVEHISVTPQPGADPDDRSTGVRAPGKERNGEGGAGDLSN